MIPKALPPLPNIGLWVGGFYSLWLQAGCACHARSSALGWFLLLLGHAILPFGYGRKPIPKVTSKNEREIIVGV